MESSEKESLLKAKSLLRMYQDHFAEITFTIHPAGRVGEVRGKSSNVAWASSEMARRMRGMPLENIILTVMDADTAFAQDYFWGLEEAYLKATKEEQKALMFAPCTVFDRYV